MDTPTVQQYLEVLERLENELSSSALKLLKIHYQAPEHTLTATELAQEMGYSHYGGANLQYGKLGRTFCEELDLHPKYKISALVTFTKPKARQQWLLTMRPEVVHALDILKWF